MNTFDRILSEALDKLNYKAGVAIVQYRNKWLLGLSTADDDRKNKWCMPGGGIKPNETPEKAAVRECWEETGIRCKSVGKAFEIQGKKGVAFVHCKADSIPKKLNVNHEFVTVGFFTVQEMKSLKLYKNVLKLIEKVS